MQLTPKEKKVLGEFKRLINAEFSGEILNVTVFGSKARGDASINSDIDVIVITLFDDWEKGDRIREIGYDLDEEIDYKLSIQVISQSHINYLSQNNFHFSQNIKKEGIAI